MEPSRLSVGLAGMEIGLWNSIGYLSQAIGLRTTAASTVRKSVCVINFLMRLNCDHFSTVVLTYHVKISLAECVHLLNGSGDCTYA
jgi:hypothetical protein